MIAPAQSGASRLALNADGSRVALSNGHLHLFDDRLRALSPPRRHSGALAWRGEELLLGGSPDAPPAQGPVALVATARGVLESLGGNRLRWHVEGRVTELAAPSDHLAASPRGTRAVSWDQQQVALIASGQKPTRLTHGGPRREGERIQDAINHLRPHGACFSDEDTLWVLWSTWNATVLERRAPSGEVVASFSLKQRLSEAGSPLGLLVLSGQLVVVCTQAFVVVEPAKGKTVATVPLKSLALASSSDGARLAALDHEGSLRLFDLDSRTWALTPRAELAPLGHVHAGRWCQATSRLHVARHRPDELETWTIDGVADAKKHTAVVLEVHPGSGAVLTSNHTRTASLAKVKLRGRIGEPTSAAFHPSEPLVALGAAVFDLSGNEVATGAVRAAVAALPDGRLITAGPDAPLAEVSWEGELVAKLQAPATDWVRWLVSSAASEAFVAVTSGVGNSKVFAFSSPAAPPLELAGFAGAPSPSGGHFATIGYLEASVFDAAGQRLAHLEGSAFSAEQGHALRFATDDVLLVPMASGALRLWRWREGQWLDLFRIARRDWCVVDEQGRLEGSPGALALALDAPVPTEGLLSSWLATLGGRVLAPKKMAKRKRARRLSPP